MKTFDKFFPPNKRKQQAFNELSKLMRSHTVTTTAMLRAADALREAQPATRKTIEDGLYHFTEAARIEADQIDAILDIYEVDDEDNKQTRSSTGTD